MPDPSPASSFFAFRTPTLPFDVLTRWSENLRSPGAVGAELDGAMEADRANLRAKLAEAIHVPAIRDALFLASPDLDETLDLWLRNELSPERQDRVDRSLVRYLARMASRPTPFGLFAACALGTWGEGTRLPVEVLASAGRHTRLDMDYLCALVEALEKDPAVRETLLYRPNNSLYEVAGRLRYAEARLGAEKGRNYHLVALEGSDYLRSTLERAANGALIETLASALVDEPISMEDAVAFIHELIDNQVLVSDLYPAVTGAEPIHGVVERLRSHPATSDLARQLDGIHQSLQAMDAGGAGCAPTVYRDLAKGLEALPAGIKLKHLFQVDLNKPAPGARLGTQVLRALEDGIDLLRRLTPARASDGMQGFKDAFQKRYESRWVPLLEALDDEIGIGFETPDTPGAEASPLLEGLAFPGRGRSSGAPFTGRDAFLLKHILTHQGDPEWELTGDDLKALENPEPPPLPDAFAVMATLAASSPEAMDRHEFRFVLEQFGGPSGARLLGRFCHGDACLEAHVRAHLAAEASLRPEALFAEVVHLPEGRMGNILCRPVLRDYEIPFLGVSGAPAERQIALQDLLVSVEDDRVKLRSKQLDREVVPRLTSAHNYSRGLSVYRFLCQMQDQGAVSGGWSWGSLEALPFLPRVRFGRQILAKARWQFEAKDLKPVLEAEGAEAYRRFHAFRATYRLPRFVVLADGDNELLVDTDHPVWLETFLQLVAKRPVFRLLECYPGPDELLAEGPEGRFTHEIAIPFVRAPQPAREAAEPPARRTSTGAPPVLRSFPPGSEWLYLKLYTGTSTADQLLVQVLDPLLEETRGLWDRWFFIRYGDPDHHLRVRFHGDPRRLMGELLPALHRAFEPGMRDGWCWKVQLDTYDPELERYGGPAGIQTAESLFWHDSAAVLELIKAYQGDSGADLRWRMGLLAVDGLLTDMGFNLEAKRGIIQAARQGFAREFNAKQGLDVQLGRKFRTLRKELDPCLFNREEPADDLRPGLEILARRSQALANCLEALRGAESAGQLSIPRAGLAPSYTHMHLNRLLRSSQRAQEFVIYDFLDRLYDSRLARSRGASAAPLPA